MDDLKTLKTQWTELEKGRDNQRYDLTKLKTLSHACRADAEQGCTIEELKTKYTYLYTCSPTMFDMCTQSTFPLEAIDSILAVMSKAPKTDSNGVIKDLCSWKKP